jgi:hypothetical protein
MTDLGTDTGLDTQARAILRANDRGGYTVPTVRLYPFQWNWDSAFVAMGFATFDEPRAWQEIEFLLRGQWEDGLIPQIIFHAPSDDYFPGPDVWGIHRSPPTSGITQPPVLASAARLLHAHASERGLAEARMAAIYPRLLRNHRWWQTARDPDRTGLVAILHPWETGMDNSPAWDDALARVPADTETVIRRRDTTHIDPTMRPRGEEYQRFIHLVDRFRAQGWNPETMYREARLRVADIGVNAILLRAERDLLALAARFGTPAEAAEIQARIDRLAAGIAAQWSEPHGLFLSRDLLTDTPISAATSAGLLPLWAQAATPAQAIAMGRTLDRWAAQVRHLVPSFDPADPRFEPLRYWRGPVWLVVNWMIAHGFAQAGDSLRAQRILADTAGLVRDHGFAEYFDPRDGHGLGGADFSWTAAIWLLADRLTPPG